ncbi:hypothetical protein [Deinococcus sp. S9]|uniref:hypothetical protein n=1 Tax=Deinococcus sp. S9 TaxID=2545754 RepID=UPI0010568626|nr:hypothetical protein [Deinococcus sp. S9]TDE85571.1 hypothetical protein E0686_11200 [Deinococcus sp. S9]
MRIRAALVRDGKWDTTRGTPLVSKATQRAYQNPTFVLFVRKKGSRQTSGAMFVFTIPPQSLTVERPTNVTVTNTRHGYVVGENGLSAPTFVLQGHFGWQLRSVAAPPQIISAAIKYNPHYDQQLGDVWIKYPTNGETGAEGLIEKFLEGKLSKNNVARFQETLDGREAYFALRDLCVYYLEENQKLMAKGKTPYELVFLDTLHDHRWVVVPKHPTLRRTADTQGTHPYTLELVGVYDDARPRKGRGDLAWSH